MLSALKKIRLTSMITKGAMFSYKKHTPEAFGETNVPEQSHKQTRDKSAEQLSYYKHRKQNLSETNFNYPEFKPTISLAEFQIKYKQLKKEDEQATLQKVAGRVSAIRIHGKTTFIDIRQQHIKLQIAISDEIKSPIRRGDIIGINGKAFVTKKGQLSILSSQLLLLAPCLWMLPQYQSLKDTEIRHRSKHLDLITNRQSVEIIIKRSQIIASLRNQLHNLGYIQVETPMLSTSCGGALAKPFVTYHNDQKMNLYLRIAPQLDLKKLLVGGVTKVFEIGKNFRNQSIDQTHNPQFTSCQLYCSYANYQDMMKFTHQLINNIAKQVNGDCIISGSQSEIDLSQKWEQKDFMKGLEDCVGKQLPVDFQEPEVHEFYDNLCKQLKIVCESPRTISRLLDKLGAHFLEDTKNPLIIKNHPKIMSPLAKPIPQKPYLTQRFELFINGFELVNSYSELNDPRIQKKNTPNEKQFIQAIQYGLTPCAGWGIGIDRLVMLLAGKDKIQQVISFPLMKTRDKSDTSPDIL